MPTDLTHNLRNWYCPRCAAWLSSTDIDEAKRHRDCGKRCEWREFLVECFEIQPLKLQDSRT